MTIILKAPMLDPSPIFSLERHEAYRRRAELSQKWIATIRSETSVVVQKLSTQKAQNLYLSPINENGWYVRHQQHFKAVYHRQRSSHCCNFVSITFDIYIYFI